MKAVIIGYGSIAQKHEKILKSLGLSVSIVSRRPDIGSYKDIKDALKEDYDLAILATETASHIPILKNLLEMGFKNPIIVEKPLCITSDELDSLGNVDNVWVAYNLRFHPAIEALKEIIDNKTEDFYYAHFHVGQILSSWRKDRDHVKTYSAIRKLGGGVVHDLSHEIDLACWFFGDLKVIKSKIGKFGSITVDSDDLCMIIAETRDIPLITMNLNYLDHSLNRTAQMTGNKSSIHIDLVQSTMRLNGQLNSYPEGMELSYYNMWRHILLNICPKGKSDTMCTFKEAKRLQGFINKTYEANAREYL